MSSSHTPAGSTALHRAGRPASRQAAIMWRGMPAEVWCVCVWQGEATSEFALCDLHYHRYGTRVLLFFRAYFFFAVFKTRKEEARAFHICVITLKRNVCVC
eukprot:TRINITY_DN56932_c0_g1_i1.p2 TRINITY_DN56932_c0_g1~~TRINITY_DN56932_c0_g1_i1.p2  ORF type:complete len:101 (-),score=4.81 TRINITY_DN56932_c0_g1_i1:12-314(-)